MTFELPVMTTVRVLDVRTLAAKNREPGDLVGAQLLMRATLPLSSLAMFDPSLPDLFARKAEPKVQGQLEGVEEMELTEVGKHVKSMPWAYDQSGNVVEIDRGLGGNSNLRLADCTVHSVSWKVQEGVAVTYTWTVDAPSLAETIRGKLTSLKRTEIPITQVGPQAEGQQDLAPAPKLTPKQLREANAEGKTIEQKAAEVKGAEGMQPLKAWPFPSQPPEGHAHPKDLPEAQDAGDALAADVAKHGPAPTASPKPLASRRGAASAKATMPPARYRSPDGQTWTGRGLKPLWLVNALDRGAKLADFEVKGH